MKKRIALFMTPLLNQGGGAEKYFISLAKKLFKKNAVVHVVTLDEKFNFRLFIFYHILHCDFSFLFKKVKITNREKKEQIIKDLFPAKWIIASEKSLKNVLSRYDAIYAKNEIIDLLPLKLIGYEKLPPVIVGIHTPLSYPATNLISLIHNFIYKGFVYRILTSGVKLFHVSNKFALQLVKKISNKPVKLIYYPFSIDEIASLAKKYQSPIKFTDHKIKILFSGRLSQQKGISRLANLIWQLSTNHLHYKIEINIFGTGDEKSTKIINKLKQNYRFVKYHGHIENKFMPAIIKKHQMLISTSLWETLPYNILEAQALGLPVVAYNIPGPSDIVIHKKTGFLVTNENDFYKAVCMIITKKVDFSSSQIIDSIKKKFGSKLIYNNLSQMLFNKKNVGKKLNFGCGRDIKKGWVNVDISPFKGVDKTFDFNVFPYPFEENSFEEIYADNVLEHLVDVPKVMKELHRITKKNGLIRIIVPYYNCYGSYNDVTHLHYFSHHSFKPFYKPDTRGNYFIKEKFALKVIKFIPTRLGKLLLFDFIRLPLSQIFGQIIQTIDLTLIIKK